LIRYKKKECENLINPVAIDSFNFAATFESLNCLSRRKSERSKDIIVKTMSPTEISQMTEFV
jgi:hypothetical protein